MPLAISDRAGRTHNGGFLLSRPPSGNIGGTYSAEAQVLERIALAAIIGAISGFCFAKREEDDPIAHLMSILPQHIVDAIENHIDGIEPITQTHIAWVDE